MSTITYRSMNAGLIGAVAVYLDGKKIGVIHKVDGGFQYRTKSGSRGEIFKTLAAVKTSLEAL